MFKKPRIFLLIFFLSLSIFGCATVKTPTKYNADDAVYKRFPDIPIPQGSKFIYKDSFVFENAAVRTALFKYQTTLSAPEGSDYFRKNMKDYGWKLESVIEAQEELLSFHNQKEICFITIIPKGGSSIILIRLLPKTDSYLQQQGSTSSSSK